MLPWDVEMSSSCMEKFIPFLSVSVNSQDENLIPIFIYYGRQVLSDNFKAMGAGRRIKQQSVHDRLIGIYGSPIWKKTQ
jgi:hypothetical protein